MGNPELEPRKPKQAKDVMAEAFEASGSDINDVDDILGYGEQKDPKKEKEDAEKARKKREANEAKKEKEDAEQQKRVEAAYKLLNTTADVSDQIDRLGAAQKRASESKRAKGMAVYERYYGAVSKAKRDEPRPVTDLNDQVVASYSKLLRAVKDELKNPDIVRLKIDGRPANDAEKTAYALANVETRKATKGITRTIQTEYSKHQRCANELERVLA